MNKRGMALLFVLPFSAAGAMAIAAGGVRASANSAPPFWSGSDTAGSILTDDRCPIEVEGEKLTIRVGALPEGSVTVYGASAYRGKVEAEYTFKNPTDETLEVKLAFPFGGLPDYIDASDFYSDTSVYGIYAGEEEIPYALRCSYTRSRWGNDFDVERDLVRLYGRGESFYTKDLPLHATTYELDLSDAEGSDEWMQFGVLFDLDGKKTRVFSTNGEGNMVLSNGHARCLFGFYKKSFPVRTIYSVGEPLSVVGTKVFRYVEGEECEVEGAKIKEGKSFDTTFGAFVENLRPKESGISEDDWFNAYVDMLEENADSECAFLSSAYDPLYLEKEFLMRWLEYKLTVPANGTLVNTVHAPIYPEVDFSRRDNRVLTYTYLLSPAQKWAKFGSIEIFVETPLFLSEGSLDFQKTEGGYRFERGSLPLGELEFSLSEKEISHKVQYSPYDDGDTALIIAIVLLSLFVAAGIAVTVTLVVRGRQRKKRREEEERRMLLGRTEEGEVDLPPAPNGDSPTAPPTPPHRDDPSNKE